MHISYSWNKILFFPKPSSGHYVEHHRPGITTTGFGWSLVQLLSEGAITYWATVNVQAVYAHCNECFF